MPILQIIFLLRSGIVIHSKHFSKDLPNVELISPFVSAIISFAKHSFKDSNLSNIIIGNNLLTICPGFLEDIEDLLGIMVSTGIDDSTAHALLSEIMESLSIHIEHRINSGEFKLEDFKKGKMPNFEKFDKIIEEIANWERDTEFINYDLSVSVPRNVIDTIHRIFLEKEDIGEIYQYKESSLIEQMLLEFLYYDLGDRIKNKYDRK